MTLEHQPDNSNGADAHGVRRLVRTASTATLATLDADSRAPYASLVSVATAMDGAPLMLMSTLAQHRRNIEADPRVSLLFESGGGGEDPLAGPRVSVMGRAAVTTHDPDARRFRARHPAAFYAEFKDFDLFRVAPERAHLIAGFGRVSWIGGTEMLLDAGDARTLEEAEPDIIAHMNRDHADAVALYATMLIGAEPAAWEMTGIDPEGVDIAAAERRHRLPFQSPVHDAAAAREALVALVSEARARGDT